MITDNDIKRQNIINLERSILIHIINKSPEGKLAEIRDKIKRLQTEIAKEEAPMSDYYCGAYWAGGRRPIPAPIGYGEWKEFKFEQLERFKRMTDEEVKDICGVNPDLLSPHYKEDEELVKSMIKKSFKGMGEQTYAKDEGLVEMNLKGLQKLWKAIYKEKRSKKEKRERMKVLILTKIIGGIVKYKKVKSDSKLFFYRQGYSHKINDEVYCYDDKLIWRIFKILDQRRLPITLIMKIRQSGKDRSCSFTVKKNNIEKIGFSKAVFKSFCREVTPGYLIRCNNENWTVIEILEAKKKKRKSKSVFGYIPRPIPFNIPDYMKAGFGAKKKKLDPFIEKRRPKGGLRGTSPEGVIIDDLTPKGVVFSEFAIHPINWEMPDYMKGLFKGSEKPNIVFSYHRKAGRNIAYQIIKAKAEQAKKVEKMVLAGKLKEFHKKPYLSVTLEEVKGKHQGEENYKKIKFPCYCSYEVNGREYLGRIDKGQYHYHLSNEDLQKDFSIVDFDPTLLSLMIRYDIHILKAEVKLYKEVGEYTK